jgi:hypothetical protein
MEVKLDAIALKDLEESVTREINDEILATIGNPFLSIDLLIDQLTLIKKMAAEKGVTNVRMAISLQGTDGFTTPFITTLYPPVLLEDYPGNYLILMARKDP